MPTSSPTTHKPSPSSNHATDAVLPFLPPKALNRAEMMARPHKNIAWTWDETYTLPENFYLAYQRGAGTRYRQLAQRFLQDDTYFGPLAATKTCSPASTPTVTSTPSAPPCRPTSPTAARSTSTPPATASRFVQAQSYATGGWGPDESFRKPGTDELADSLTHTHSTFETPCGAYGHFKITRYLMRVTGDSRYGDSMETVLYNTILGARPIRPTASASTTPTTIRRRHQSRLRTEVALLLRHLPPAHRRLRHQLLSPQRPTASTSTSTCPRASPGSRAAHASHSRNTPHTPTTATPPCTSRSPSPSASHIALRIPAWAGNKTRVTVNGSPADVALTPGTWATIDRTWKDGDRVELSIDMPLRLAPIDEHHPQLVALLYGPVALFAIEPAANTITQKQLLAAQRIGDSSAWEVATDTGKVRMLPYPDIKDESYRLYQQT